MIAFEVLLLFVVILVIYFVRLLRENRKLLEIAAKIPGTQLHWSHLITLFFFTPSNRIIAKQHSFLRKDTPITKLWVGPLLYVLTSDADFMKKVFTLSQCNKKPLQIYDAFLVDDNLLCSSGSQHERYRKVLNHAFSKKN